MAAAATVYETTPQRDFVRAERISTRTPRTMPVYHHHDTLEVYYLVRGERFYFITDRVIHLGAGDIVLIDANTIHRTIDSGAGAFYERVLVELSRDTLTGARFADADRLRSLFRPEYRLYRPEGRTADRLQAVFAAMIEDCGRGCPDGSRDGLCNALLLELLILLDRAAQTNGEGPCDHPSPLHAKISNVVTYLNTQYTLPLTLDAVADRFAISKYYLCRTFRRITGFTVHTYLNAVRTKEAKRLLRTTNASATAIAVEVGFTGISQLDRVFRRHVGLAPTEYRARRNGIVGPRRAETRE